MQVSSPLAMHHGKPLFHEAVFHRSVRVTNDPTPDSKGCNPRHLK
jgi:hypothetical protein